MAHSTDIAGPPFPIVAVLDSDGTIAWVSEEWRQVDPPLDATDEDQATEDCSTSETGGDPATSTRTEATEYMDQIAAAVRDLCDADDSPAVVCDQDLDHGDRWVCLSVTGARIAGETRRLVVYRQVPNGEAGEPTAYGRFPGDETAQSSNRLVTYTLDPNETATEGLLAAFDAIGVDAQNRDTTLQDCLATDPINSMYRMSEAFHLTFHVWGHAVVLTPEELTIYASDAE